jgi:uncharacterized protein YbbK (DUF523 family)
VASEIECAIFGVFWETNSEDLKGEFEGSNDFMSSGWFSAADCKGSRGKSGRPAAWASRRSTVLRIGISSCLLGEAVRWDGGHKRDRFIADRLSRHLECVPICPELEAGMGVPREALRLVGSEEAPRMVGVRSGKDWTVAMREYARTRVRQLEAMDLAGFVLKKDSPSCGMERVRVHSGKGSPSRRGVGLFARELVIHLPLLPVEEEGRLQDPVLRKNFIERIFAYRRLKDLLDSGCRRGDLVAFHAAHKYLLL